MQQAQHVACTAPVLKLDPSLQAEAVPLAFLAKIRCDSLRIRHSYAAAAAASKPCYT
jgi:hypothetical protein